MSIVYDILEELCSVSLNYKGVRVNLLGLPKFEKYSQGSLRGTMSHLIKEGLVEDCDGLYITPKGKNYIRRKNALTNSIIKSRETTKRKSSH